MMIKIGFIGLGVMGEPMCENIIKKTKYEVYAYDINQKQIEQMVKLGAKAALSVSEIGEKCDTIIIMVPKSEDVNKVVTELITTIKTGTLIIDMSTIEPSMSVTLSENVRGKNCLMIDAPVVKSKSAAIEGKLGIYVGGDKRAFERALPILKYMGENIIYMGKNGSGLIMKMCHNMLVGEIQNGVNEMLILANSANLNFDDVVTAISYGGGQNYYLDSKKDKIKENNFEVMFSVENMYKDINIALNIAKGFGLNLPGAKNVRKVYEEALKNNLNKKDFSVTVKVVEKLAKLNRRDY